MGGGESGFGPQNPKPLPGTNPLSTPAAGAPGGPPNTSGYQSLGSIQDLTNWASTDAAQQLLGVKSQPAALQALQAFRIDPSTGHTFTGGGTIDTAGVGLAFNQWMKTNAAYQSSIEAADTLLAAKPGRQQTILTPQTAAGPKSLLGGG
jgi:hypothetical protein